jgi:hypothetical protein
MNSAICSGRLDQIVFFAGRWRRWSGIPISRIAEPISEPRFREDVFRPERIVFDFLAKGFDV